MSQDKEREGSLARVRLKKAMSLWATFSMMASSSSLITTRMSYKCPGCSSAFSAEEVRDRLSLSNPISRVTIRKHTNELVNKVESAVVRETITAGALVALTDGINDGCIGE